jgi:hypothetical protein
MKLINFIGMVNMSCLLLMGTGFSSETADTAIKGESNRANSSQGEEGNVQEDRNPLREDNSTEKPPAIPPPSIDPGIVVQPDVPQNPKSIITPPPVDPEMAVDPFTREPMTKEDLEDLQQKNESGGTIPDQEEQRRPRPK